MKLLFYNRLPLLWFQLASTTKSLCRPRLSGTTNSHTSKELSADAMMLPKTLPDAVPKKIRRKEEGEQIKQRSRPRSLGPRSSSNRADSSQSSSRPSSSRRLGQEEKAPKEERSRSVPRSRMRMGKSRGDHSPVKSTHPSGRHRAPRPKALPSLCFQLSSIPKIGLNARQFAC